jgi:hypothetical protein
MAAMLEQMVKRIEDLDLQSIREENPKDRANFITDQAMEMVKEACTDLDLERGPTHPRGVEAGSWTISPTQV